MFSSIINIYCTLVCLGLLCLLYALIEARNTSVDDWHLVIPDRIFPSLLGNNKMAPQRTFIYKGYEVTQRSFRGTYLIPELKNYYLHTMKDVDDFIKLKGTKKWLDIIIQILKVLLPV